MAVSPSPLLFHIESEGTLVMICNSVRLSTSSVKALMDIMEEHSLTHIQLVYKHPVTNHTQNLIPQIRG